MPFDLASASETVAAVAAEHAVRTDAEGRYPTEFMEACRSAGLLGLVSSKDVGGLGGGLRQAAQVVERVARECGSSAMVLTMHYCGSTVIEAHGALATRREVAAGRHVSTLAFSESGSRSHFWAPLSTARVDGDVAVLDAKKSWVTTAQAADSYVWSSRPASGNEASTLWLVPSKTAGIALDGPFDGIGLRGNDSRPVRAQGARVPLSARLGADGAGFGIMMQTVLPTFSVLISSGSVDIAEATVQKTAEHASKTKYEHMASSLADLPTVRAYIARMRIQADATRTLWADTIEAPEKGRPDAMLRVLEVKAATAEAAREITDTAMPRVRRTLVPQGRRRRAALPRCARGHDRGPHLGSTVRLHRQGRVRPAPVLRGAP